MRVIHLEAAPLPGLLVHHRPDYAQGHYRRWEAANHPRPPLDLLEGALQAVRRAQPLPVPRRVVVDVRQSAKSSSRIRVATRGQDKHNARHDCQERCERLLWRQQINNMVRLPRQEDSRNRYHARQVPSWLTMHGPRGWTGVHSFPKSGHSSGLRLPSMIR